jgi:hypothetical protein
LLVNVTNLEPYVLLGQWTWRILNNVFKALGKSMNDPVSVSNRTYFQTLSELLLLLVYYAETEIDFIRLLEVWLHSHDLRESLFGMFKRAIAIIQNTNAIPELRLLETRVSERLHTVLRATLPLDQLDGIALVGKQSRPAAGRPSSGSSGLRA